MNLKSRHLLHMCCSTNELTANGEMGEPSDDDRAHFDRFIWPMTMWLGLFCTHAAKLNGEIRYDGGKEAIMLERI